MQKWVEEKRSILFEGAQGTLLDIDHGTYPYVTSSSTTAGGVSTGLGIGPKYIDKIIGISKAYTTRVGERPFITELFDDNGKMLAERGNEFGATTGRPRRCGWLDLVALKKAIFTNSVTDLCITKLDVLDEMKKINVLHLTTTSNIRGSEKLVIDMSDQSNSNKFNYLICTLYPLGDLHSLATSKNIRSFSLNVKINFI